jgi:beta-lactamase class A
MAGAPLERGDVAIARFVAAAPGRSIAVEALAGPAWSRHHDAHAARPAASLFKVPLAVAVHRAAAGGRLDLACRVRVDELPASRFASVLDALSPDHVLTLRELCGFMLATSDNRAARHLLSLVGADAVNDVLAAAGCRASRMAAGYADDELGPRGRANVATAADMLELLRFLHGHPQLADVVHAMERNPLNARIPLRLPDDGRISVANKTGSLAGVVDDIALVREGSLVLAVAVLCDGQSDNARTGIEIGDCVRELWAAAGGRLEP